MPTDMFLLDMVSPNSKSHIALAVESQKLGTNVLIHKYQQIYKYYVFAITKLYLNSSYHKSWEQYIDHSDRLLILH